MTIESSRQDIVPIQMLRGIAASMVVFVHLDVQLERLGYRVLGSGWLATGVDIFFVISGFIMWVSVERRPTMTAGQFFQHRLIRIVPLYWVVSAGLLAMTLIAPNLLHTTVFSAHHAVVSFLFLPARHPVTANFWPLLIPGWTLNYEMLFYLLFAAAIAGSNGSARVRLLLAASLIAAVVIVGNALQDRIDVMHFYANPILFEFLAGIFIGILYLQRSPRSSPLWLAAILLGFLMLWRGPALGGLHPLANLVAAAMIVAGALFSPRLPVPGLARLGDASYSLYLTHVVTLAALGSIWAAGFRALGSPAFIVCALLSCAIGGLLCYQLIERPLTRVLKRLWQPERKQSRALPSG